MSLLIFIISFLFLVSCSNEKEYKIAIFISGEGRSEKVRGFLEGLKDLNVNFTYKIFKGDNTLSSLEKLSKELYIEAKRYDLIAAGGSLEAYFLKKEGVNKKVPIVLLGGTAIKQWGLTKDLSSPTENITGVDNRNAELMEKRVELFKKFFPNINKAILSCTPKFEASKYAAKITIETGKKLGIKIVPVYVKNVKDLEFVISHMKEDGYGAIIMTPCYYTENFLTHYILHYAGFYKVPVFCHSIEFVKKGCPVGYGTSGYQQGYQAAHIAYKVLKGYPVSNVPFERVYYPKLVVNEKSLYEFGIKLTRSQIFFVDEVIK